MQFTAFDDFNDPVARAGGGQRGTRSLIAGIGEDAQNEREQSSRAPIENECRTVAVLDIGRVNGSAQQQTECIYENVALLALDLLARVITRWIDAGPPFSALLTLWLSMIAAVGLASRSSRSLHFT